MWELSEDVLLRKDKILLEYPPRDYQQSIAFIIITLLVLPLLLSSLH